MGVSLSPKQQHQIDSIEKFISGVLIRKDYALFLNLSERSVSRIASQVRRECIAAILHGNKGQVPANKSSDELKGLAYRYAFGKYYDFNILHMLEKLQLDINLVGLMPFCSKIILKYEPSKVKMLKSLRI